jgi:APA family basic amino acid/polyamine antiporter
MGAGLGIAMIILSSNRETGSVFTFIALVATVGTLVTYLLGALAALHTKSSVPQRAVILLGTAFTFFAFYGAGMEANAWGLLLIAMGLAVRAGTRVAQVKPALVVQRD